MNGLLKRNAAYFPPFFRHPTLFFLVVFIIWNLFVPIESVLRLSGVSLFVGIDKVVVPAYVILVAFFIFTKQIRMDFLARLLIFMLIYGMMISLYKLYVSSDDDVRAMVALSFGAFMSVVIYLYFSSIDVSMEKINISLTTHVFPFLLFAIHVISIVINSFFICMGMINYLGFSTNTIMIPFSFYYFKGKYFYAAMLFALGLLTGKRGVIIFMPILILFIEFIRSKNGWNYVKRIFIAYVLLPVIFFSLIQMMKYVHLFHPLYIKFLKKWTAIFKIFHFHNSNDMLAATSGRFDEIKTSTVTLGHSITHWLFGLGFGFNISDPKIFLPRHFVHFSPMDYILQYGVVVSFVFFIAIACLFARLLMNARMAFIRGRYEHFPLCVLYLLGMLFAAFSSYIVGSDFTFWVFLGLSVALERHYKTQKTSVRY